MDALIHHRKKMTSLIAAGNHMRRLVNVTIANGASTQVK